MDAKDRQIIRALQENGRISNLNLAQKVNLSPSPCLRRTRILEQLKIILGYRVVVDAAAYGLPLTAFVRIKLEKHASVDVRRFESRVMHLPNVIECHCLSGAMDYQLKVVAPDMFAYEAFIKNDIQTLQGVAVIESSFSFSSVKVDAVFPDL